MRFVLFTFCILSSCSALLAGNIHELLKLAEEAKANLKHKDAADHYFKILAIDSNHYETLWKASQICLHIGWLENNKEKGGEWYKKAMIYARKAYLQKPESQESNTVMAVSIARNAQFIGPRGRVNACWKIKEHADKALSVHKNDPGIWQLMAWWNFELGRATWLEKSLASVLFGGLPKGGTCDEAFECLKKAQQLNPNYIGYWHDFAVFYHRLGQDDIANDYVNKALKAKAKNPADRLYQKKCKALKQKL